MRELRGVMFVVGMGGVLAGALLGVLTFHRFRPPLLDPHLSEESFNFWMRREAKKG